MIAPPPGIHPDLPARITLPSAHENRPPPRVEIRLDPRQRFLDPKPTTPQHDDQRSQSEPVTIGRRLAHHGDDLVDRRRIRRVDHPLVPRRAPGVMARHRCRRASPTGGVEQQLSRRHRSLPSRAGRLTNPLYRPSAGRGTAHAPWPSPRRCCSLGLGQRDESAGTSPLLLTRDNDEPLFRLAQRNRAAARCRRSRRGSSDPITSSRRCRVVARLGIGSSRAARSPALPAAAATRRRRRQQTVETWDAGLSVSLDWMGVAVDGTAAGASRPPPSPRPLQGVSRTRADGCHGDPAAASSASQDTPALAAPTVPAHASHRARGSRHHGRHLLTWLAS
jgi:hypothetical protein